MKTENNESAEECLRSISDADERYVRPVLVESKKGEVILTPALRYARQQAKGPLVVPTHSPKSWLTKERHLLPAKWRPSEETQQTISKWALAAFGIYLVISISVGIVQAISAEMWRILVVSVLVLVVVTWAFSFCWNLLLYFVRSLGRAWRDQ